MQACVAERPEILQQAFLTQSFDPRGKYKIRLWKHSCITLPHIYMALIRPVACVSHCNRGTKCEAYGNSVHACTLHVTCCLDIAGSRKDVADVAQGAIAEGYTVGRGRHR